MDDWEDAGLAIGIVALIFLCTIVTSWRLSKQEDDDQEEDLLDNPV
jgi:hypothetical protein